MVRDAYSAGGQPQQADGGAAGQPMDLRDSTASLTQELSQLLAASIAQGQAGKRAPSAMAGSELANLAALVSASQSQRNIQPSYRDGLSSLTYARPTHHPAPPPPAPAPVSVPAPAPGSLLVSEPHDEEPMPIPSTWRQPVPSDDDRWYRQQLGAAGLGLVAGLVVVVPAVLWLSGWLGGPQTSAATRRQPTPDPATVRMAEVKVNKVTVASMDARAPVAAPAEPVAPARTRPVVEERPPVAVVTPPRVEPERSRSDELLTQAKRRIDSGDVAGARDILQATEAVASGAMMFLLAETYDPNMLASWQTRGVTANPERARALYQRARDLGDIRAQQRIDWLTGN